MLKTLRVKQNLSEGQMWSVGCQFLNFLLFSSNVVSNCLNLVLALVLTYCVIFSELLNISVPQFSYQ